MPPCALTRPRRAATTKTAASFQYVLRDLIEGIREPIAHCPAPVAACERRGFLLPSVRFSVAERAES